MKYFIILHLCLLFIACSEYPEMESDILAQHIYSQNPIELASSDSEYVAMIAKSFGISEDEVVGVQKHILSKKSTNNMKRDYEAALHKKISELKQRKSESARKDFVVNVLAPYLDAEFSAHVTEAIFSPIPNVALLSAIQRMRTLPYFSVILI